MDPAPSFLYEMEPNGSGSHAESGARVTPHFSLQNPYQQLFAERSLSKEKRDVNKSRPAEMSGNEAKSYQMKDLQAVQHLPALVSLTQSQAQVSSISLNVLPAVSHPPLQLRALPPGAMPGLMCAPCPPPPSYWLPPASPHWLSSNLGFRPYLLHPLSSPPKFWSKPFLFPPILRPQMMPIHPSAAGQASGSTQTHVTPASERGEKHAGAGGQRSRNHVKEDEQNKPQEGNAGTDNNPGSKRKITDSPELSPFWYEELMEEDGFEECMKLLDSFFAQAKTTGVECGDTGTQMVENDSFLEYLDELCSDKDFVRKVESLLEIETFMPSLAPGQDLLDVFAQEQQEQEIPSLPANSDSLSEETAPLSHEQVLLMDPPGIQSAASPKQKEQNSPKTEDWIWAPPLLPSHLLEEPHPADSPLKDSFPPPEESQTPLDVCSAPSHNGIFMPMTCLFTDTDLEGDDGVFSSLWELTTPPPEESPSTSRQGPNLSADLLTESLQKSTCQPPYPQPPAPPGKPEGHVSSRFAAHDSSVEVHSDPCSFNFPVRRTLSELEHESQTEKPTKRPRRRRQEEREGKDAEMRGPQKQGGGEKKVGRKTLEKEEQVHKNKIKVEPGILIRRNQKLLDESKQEKDGERKTRDKDGEKPAKLSPKRNEAVQQKRGENELFKRRKGKKSQKTKMTSTAEQQEKLKNPQLDSGKWGEPSNLTFCSETGVSKDLFYTAKRVRPTSTTSRKTKRSQEDRGQTGKSLPLGETEGIKLQAKESVLQNVPIISPVKRRRSMRGGEEQAGAVETVSARPTKETKAPLKEGREPERPSSANTSVTTSGSPRTRCRKSKTVVEGAIWNMRPEVQTSAASDSEPSPGAGARDDEEPSGERPSLTRSPVKRLGRKREAAGVRAQSADNTRMENKQLQPKKKHEGTETSKSSKEQQLRRK